MADDLYAEIERYLESDREDRSGLEYLHDLGAEGVQRLAADIEADYDRALAQLQLSGRDVARVTVLAHLLARAAGIDNAAGRDTMTRLVEVGWLMARWYEHE